MLLPRIYVQWQSALELSWYMLFHVCKPYAIAMRLQCVW